jgi:hypothetical protein
MSAEVSKVRAAFIIRALIALIMEAACTSETSVDIQLSTRQYIPEYSQLHQRHSFENKAETVHRKAKTYTD